MHPILNVQVLHHHIFLLLCDHKLNFFNCSFFEQFLKNWIFCIIMNQCIIWMHVLWMLYLLCSPWNNHFQLSGYRKIDFIWHGWLDTTKMPFFYYTWQCYVIKAWSISNKVVFYSFITQLTWIDCQTCMNWSNLYAEFWVKDFWLKLCSWILVKHYNKVR